MKTYRVERVDGETTLASQEAMAKTPFEAAEKALGRKVTLRGGASKWVRVTELSNKAPTRLRPSVFEFKALGQWLTQLVSMMWWSAAVV